MTGLGPDLGALLHADPPGPLPAGFADRVEAAASRLRSRTRRRRVMLTGSTAIAALVATGGIAISGSDSAPDSDTLQPAAAESASPKAGLVMPDLSGLDSTATESRAYRLPPQTVPNRYVASNDVPVGKLLGQSPAPGSPIDDGTTVVLTFSAGGPAVPLSEVPPPARAILTGAIDAGELVRVLRTSAGDGYKTDDMLTGPCSVTARLYRNLPFPDPVYETVATNAVPGPDGVSDCLGGGAQATGRR